MTDQTNPELPPTAPVPASTDQDIDEISLLDIALMLAENLRILTLVPLAAGLVALGYSYVITPTFTATTRMLPPLQQQSASAALATQFGALAGLAGGAAGIKNPLDQFVALFKSGPVLDAMIERFKLKEVWTVKYTEDARRTLEGITRVSVGARDGIISIEVDDQDPQRAANMANAYVDELRNLLKTLAVTEAAQRRVFFEKQLKQAKDNLTKSEIALRGSGISEATLKTVPQTALEALARIKAQIAAQEIKLASMRTSMTDSNPDFKVALQELIALRTELSKAEQSSATKAVGTGAEYVSNFRDFKYNETLFDLMVKQYEIARIDEAREGQTIQVLDVAQPPERRSKPYRSRIAVLTTVVVFFIMIVFVFVWQTLRNIAKDKKSAEKLGRLRQVLRLRRA